MLAWQLALAILIPAAEPPAPAKPRPPWTTSQVRGRPEPPPPLRTVQAFPKLKFVNPLAVMNGPGRRIYVVERGGKILSFPDDDGAANAEVAIDLANDLAPFSADEQLAFDAAYGLAFHPRFAENRQCFVCYVVRKTTPGNQQHPDGTRVSRFKVAGAPPRIDPKSEEILLTFRGGGHNGGDLQFGADGMLYISSGDSENPNPADPLRTGQDCSDLLASILRIDVDQPDREKKYGVPKDNPFVGQAKVRPEIWAFGFRNPWRMSFDRATGHLWVGDVGWELWESTINVKKGGNYGWSVMEGPQPIHADGAIGPTPILPPTLAMPHTISASVTGGYVYRGSKFPEFVGHYFWGDWETHRLWSAKVEGDKLAPWRDVADSDLRVVAFGEDHAKELLIADYDAGTLHRFERRPPAAASAAFPRKLSETGLFAEVAKHQWAAGVVPYEINVSLWQDGAVAERAIAIPGSAKAKLFPKDQDILKSMFSRRIEFPQDTVLAKTIALDLVAGDATSRRRIETQLLHFDGAAWRGYGYRWNDAQTDAELVPAEGDDHTFVVKDAAAAGGMRGVAWSFASRDQCLQCHTPWLKSTLAFNLHQLNRPAAGAPQLQRLADLGVWEPAPLLGMKPPKLDAKDHPALADPLGAGPLGERARSYLHVNCGHCHCFGGGGAVDMQLQYFCKPAQMKVENVPPARGAFGLPDAKLVAPGAPGRSVLYYRMAKHGSGRMPHLGSEHADAAGLEVVRQWIESLGEVEAPPAPGLASPAAALELARRLGQGKLSEAERSKALAEAAQATDPAIRDLFAGWQPFDPAKAATLGPNPRPSKILALAGDPARGETLFRSDALQCAKCHKLAGAGVEVGPDLSKIGGQRTREELLESLLRPSLRIEPAFATHLVRTADGETLTGLVVERTAAEIVLRDAKGKDRRLARADLEAFRQSPVSLMPEGLLRDLTPTQAADLLAYLAARK